MKRFVMNDLVWRVIFVSPGSPKLVDRRNRLTLATTDPTVLCIYISDSLRGNELNTVLVHELGHAALFSYGLLTDIRRMVKPRYRLEAEEWFCNAIADYGRQIFETARTIID